MEQKIKGTEFWMMASIILMHRIRQNNVSGAGIKNVLEMSALLLRMKGE